MIKIIQDHTTREYFRAQSKLGCGKHNGAFYYSKEIVESFIPKIKTTYNWQTINHQKAPEHCIVFVHSNNALQRYDYLLKYKDIILVCSTNHSMNQLKKKGHKKVIYVPLSIDVDYLKKFKHNRKKNGAIACGNVWAFTKETKEYFARQGINHYHDLERESLLYLMANAKTVYAIGRTAMEAIYLGAEVIQPDKEYPVEKYTTYYTQKDAIRIMQEQLDALPKEPRIFVGMATMKGREQQLKLAIQSLTKQVDEIVLYDNSKNEDLTDNGKFYVLEYLRKNKITENAYILLCDDDLIYPHNYVKKMIDEVKKTGNIVTCHGRILEQKAQSYYRGGHKAFGCLSTVEYSGEIDVPGTGCTAFSIEYFNPKNLHKAKVHRMSDLVFALEAKKQNKTITMMPHSRYWIRQLPTNSGCYNTEVNGTQENQVKYVNQIIDLKNKS